MGMAVWLHGAVVDSSEARMLVYDFYSR
jgi:hypothetical protein